jgi:class 3 adenylate cyclase
MPDLPSGTVTFLFTDIEASTQLWERDRAAMRAAVERQLLILHSIVAAHRGVLYKTIGDGAQAAFATAEDGVRAAFDAQRALLAETWAEAPGPVRVRMVLHAGEAAPDAQGDYLAAALNRVARVLATGYGGQILLTQAAQQLTRGRCLPTSPCAIWASIDFGISWSRSGSINSSTLNCVPTSRRWPPSRPDRTTFHASPPRFWAGSGRWVRSVRCFSATILNC